MKDCHEEPARPEPCPIEVRLPKPTTFADFLLRAMQYEPYMWSYASKVRFRFDLASTAVIIHYDGKENASILRDKLWAVIEPGETISCGHMSWIKERAKIRDHF